MLEISSLSKNYGKMRGVHNVSFTVEKGEIVGFIGPNGAGKSTTMNMVTGCLAPDFGSVKANGILLSENTVGFKKLIGYLPEKPPLYNEFTTKEYLTTVLKMKGKPVSAKYISDITKRFGLAEVSERVIGNLSKGYKQRIGLAQAFVGEPQYVILDEPTVGLDPMQKRETLELIKKMKKEYGIFLSSHILSEISYVCDRVIIINDGETIKQIENNGCSKDVYAYKVIGDEKSIISTLLSCNGVTAAQHRGNIYLVETEESVLREIFWRLADAKHAIVGIEPYHTDVEDEFIKATDKDKRRRP